MSVLASSSAAALAPVRLHLVDSDIQSGTHTALIADPDTPGAHSSEGVEDRLAHVLVVGADHSSRTRMIEELCVLLAPGTPFVEANEVWQALAQAPHSRMVVLTGDLGDVSVGSLVRLLSRRHPMLPVVSIDASSPHKAAPGDVGAACH